MFYCQAPFAGTLPPPIQIFRQAGAYTPASNPSGGVYHPGFHVSEDMNQRVLTEARVERAPGTNNRSSPSHPLTLWVALLHQVHIRKRGERRTSVPYGTPQE